MTAASFAVTSIHFVSLVLPQHAPQPSQLLGTWLMVFSIRYVRQPHTSNSLPANMVVKGYKPYRHCTVLDVPLPRYTHDASSIVGYTCSDRKTRAIHDEVIRYP
jgi:hypothetical protein